MVGRRSKPDEGHQSLWHVVRIIRIGISCVANFLSRVIRSIFLFCAALILFNCTPSKKQDQVVKNDLPDITLHLVRGESHKATTLPGKVVLIFFGPDCDHCQRQAESILKQLDVFKNYSLYFIASNPEQEIIQFAEKYNLQSYPNIFFARAEVAEVIGKMGPMSVPGIFIYSDEKHLIKKFNGETAIDEIAKFL